MSQGPDEHDGDRHAGGDKERDGDHATAELREVKRQRGFKDEPGDERHQDDVAADVR